MGLKSTADPAAVSMALDRLRDLLKRRERGSISVLRIAADVGVDEKAVRKWLAGESIPTRACLRELCRVLNLKRYQ